MTSHFLLLQPIKQNYFLHTDSISELVLAALYVENIHTTLDTIEKLTKANFNRETYPE